MLECFSSDRKLDRLEEEIRKRDCIISSLNLEGRKNIEEIEDL